MDWIDDEEDMESVLLNRLENLEVISDLSMKQRAYALIAATRQKKELLVKALIINGANVNEEDEFGCTPVMFAGAHGLVECLEAMLSLPQCSINKRSHSMQTALHFAAKRGQSACVEVLLKHGAMQNVSDDWGETPLMLAVKAGCNATCNMLLNSGSRLGLTNLRGMDALMYASQGGHTAIMKCLIKHGCEVNRVYKTSPLHQAAVYGHTGCVNVLLKAGVQSDVRDVHGVLPIELATNTDKHEVVELLLEHGTTDEFKCMALAAAAKANAFGSVHTLLQWNTRPGAVDMQGLPAFFWAVAQNNIEIVKLFIRYSVDINKTLSRVYLINSELREFTSELDLDFISAVVIAAYRNHSDLVRILVQAGAYVDDVQKLLEQNQLPCSLLRNDPMVSLLQHHSSRPRSLAFICRKEIRENLTNVALNQIWELPLPKPIQDFLNFSDLDLT